MCVGAVGAAAGRVSDLAQYRQHLQADRRPTPCSRSACFVVILTAGIDLSVGSVLALGMMTLAVSNAAGVPWPIVLMLSPIMGVLAAGFVNGIGITKLRMPHPFIMTLGHAVHGPRARKPDLGWRSVLRAARTRFDSSDRQRRYILGRDRRNPDSIFLSSSFLPMASSIWFSGYCLNTPCSAAVSTQSAAIPQAAQGQRHQRRSHADHRLHHLRTAWRASPD